MSLEDGHSNLGISAWHKFILIHQLCLFLLTTIYLMVMVMNSYSSCNYVETVALFETEEHLLSSFLPIHGKFYSVHLYKYILTHMKYKLNSEKIIIQYTGRSAVKDNLRDTIKTTNTKTNQYFSYWNNRKFKLCFNFLGGRNLFFCG